MKSPDELQAEQKAQREAEIQAQVEAEIEAEYEAKRAARQEAEREAEREIALEAARAESELETRIVAANADGRRSAKAETSDRTTIIAFGLLFILPAVIIVFSILFFLPFIARTVQQEPTSPEPTGATTLRSNSSGLTPDNR